MRDQLFLLPRGAAVARQSSGASHRLLHTVWGMEGLLGSCCCCQTHTLSTQAKFGAWDIGSSYVKCVRA